MSSLSGRTQLGRPGDFKLQSGGHRGTSATQHSMQHPMQHRRQKSPTVRAQNSFRPDLDLEAMASANPLLLSSIVLFVASDTSLPSTEFHPIDKAADETQETIVCSDYQQ